MGEIGDPSRPLSCAALVARRRDPARTVSASPARRSGAPCGIARPGRQRWRASWRVQRRRRGMVIEAGARSSASNRASGDRAQRHDALALVASGVHRDERSTARLVNFRQIYRRFGRKARAAILSAAEPHRNAVVHYLHPARYLCMGEIGDPSRAPSCAAVVARCHWPPSLAAGSKGAAAIRLRLHATLAGGDNISGERNTVAARLRSA
jgi:hypothetical protein